MTSTDLRAVGFSEVRERITGNRLTVYDALLSAGPLTGSELAANMGWPVTSVRPRLTELCDLLHAVTTGKRRAHEHEFRALTASEALAAFAAQPIPAELPRPAPIAPTAHATRALSDQFQSGFLFA